LQNSSFGKTRQIIVAEEANYLLEETRARNEDKLREISDPVGKDFIVREIPDDNTLNSDHYHFQVKSTKHVTNAELLAPLPLQHARHPGPTGQSSSFVVVLCDTAH
jgi:hypothetical protein